MAERKHWDIGIVSDEVTEAISKFVDEQVGLFVENLYKELFNNSTIDGEGLWLFYGDETYCIDLMASTKLAISKYSGPGSDESTIQWLRAARDLLLECVAEIEKVL